MYTHLVSNVDARVEELADLGDVRLVALPVFY
jgi:hypothetical protein